MLASSARSRLPPRLFVRDGLQNAICDARRVGFASHPSICVGIPYLGSLGRTQSSAAFRMEAGGSLLRLVAWPQLG